MTMSDPRTLTPDACEILVVRELRRAGIAPVALRRSAVSTSDDGWRFDLTGRLEAYGRTWSTLIECRNTGVALRAADVANLRGRAERVRAASALLFTTAPIEATAVERAEGLRVALLRIVDAHPALLAAGLVQPGPLPAWVPELTVELVAMESGSIRTRLLEPNQPEPVLEQLRRRS